MMTICWQFCTRKAESGFKKQKHYLTHTHTHTHTLPMFWWFSSAVWSNTEQTDLQVAHHTWTLVYQTVRGRTVLQRLHPPEWLLVCWDLRRAHKRIPLLFSDQFSFCRLCLTSDSHVTCWYCLKKKGNPIPQASLLHHRHPCAILFQNLLLNFL